LVALSHRSGTRRWAIKMSPRVVYWLAWSLAAISLLLCGVGIVLYLATLSVQPPSSWGTGGLSAVLYVYLPFLAFPLVGALIASRRPENPIGWLCLAVGISWMLAIASGAYAVYGLRVAGPGSLPFPAAIGSLGESLAPATAGLIGTYLILLFPDGRLPSRSWRPLAWLSGAVIVSMSVGSVLTPGRLEDLGEVRNPFGLERYPWVGDAAQNIILLLPLCILASVASLVLRYLRSGGEERAQIKWLAFAASILGLGFSSFVILGFFVAESPTAVADPLWENLIEDTVTMSFAGVPVAVGIAILRYRLYDIDVLINRALVYGSLTATLALVYVGGVFGLQAFFRTATGQESTLAVVASTLAIAALFGPLRRWVQAIVDRRFYRRKYDAATTLAAFNARLREETNLDSLSDDLVGVARGTVQPAHVSLWLRPDAEPEVRSAAIEQFGHDE
jgi:MFS family permease